jgi:Transglycosylase SLT domain
VLTPEARARAGQAPAPNLSNLPLQSGPRLGMADKARSLIPDWARRSGSGGGTPEQQAMLRQLEEKYQLPEGTLDRLWKKETGRGRNLTGPQTRFGTAKGHFQFIDSTGAQYGLDKDGGRADRDDFSKAAPAAAKYFSDLMRMFGNNPRMAAAAYNWGPGNLSKYGLGRAPKETRDYIDAVAPITVNQDTKIYVSGAGDSVRVAEEVAQRQRGVNADTIRQFTPKVQ